MNSFLAFLLGLACAVAAIALALAFAAARRARSERGGKTRKEPRPFAREASASLACGAEAFAPQGMFPASLLEEKSRLVERKAMELREALRMEANGAIPDAKASEGADERLRESILSLASRFAAAAEGPTGEAIDEILEQEKGESLETGLASRIRALREAKRAGKAAER